jgi:hypothetical protein
MTASSASSSLLSSPIGSPPPSPLLPVPNLLNARNFSNFLYLQPAPESPELATLLSHGGGPWLRAGPSTHTQALSCCLSRFSLVAPLRGASGGWTRSTSPAPARQCPTHRQRLLGANDHSVHIDTQLHCVLSYQDMSRGCVVGRTWWPCVWERRRGEAAAPRGTPHTHTHSLYTHYGRLTHRKHTETRSMASTSMRGTPNQEPPRASPHVTGSRGTS